MTRDSQPAEATWGPAVDRYRIGEAARDAEKVRASMVLLARVPGTAAGVDDDIRIENCTPAFVFQPVFRLVHPEN